MACATLKRNHTFDLLDSSCSKRRRFHACSRQFDTGLSIPTSPFIPKEQTRQNQLKRRIKDEIKRLQRRRLIPRFLGGPAHIFSSTFTSHVRDETNVVSSCSGGIRSLVIRSPNRDGQDSDNDQSSNRNNESENSFENSLTSVHSFNQNPSTQPARSIDSVPIFTLSQVTSLCERLIKEREEELRQEYDSTLSCKLAEQYEAFLKFNHDQLYSRFKNAPMSYVS